MLSIYESIFLALDIEHMGVKLEATLSIGVAIYPQHGDTWEEVLHAADQAMYAAKSCRKKLHPHCRIKKSPSGRFFISSLSISHFLPDGVQQAFGLEFVQGVTGGFEVVGQAPGPAPDRRKHVPC